MKKIESMVRIMKYIHTKEQIELRTKRKKIEMSLTYDKLNELFAGVGLNLGEESTRKCYEALEGYYKEITKKTKRGGVSGYMMWLNDNRERIKSEYFKDVELTGRSKVTEIAKKGGELWKCLSEEEKLEWKRKASEKSGEMPKKEMRKKWSFELSNEEGDEEVEGFSGLHVGKYLKGVTENGRLRNKGTFETLSEAIRAAKLLGEKCGGVTKGRSGYQLREGIEMSEVTDKISHRYIKTWLRGDIDEEKVEETKSKKRVKKVLKKKVEEKEEKVEEKEEEVEEKEEEEEDKKEEEEESESEDEEEEEVEEWEYKGTKYLMDPNTKIVYDYDTHDEIGKEKKGKLVLKK